MTAQIYHDQKIVRVFDVVGPTKSDEAIADLPLPVGRDPSPQAGSHALRRIGLVRVGGWARTEWGWQIKVQIRE